MTWIEMKCPAIGSQNQYLSSGCMSQCTILSLSPFVPLRFHGLYPPVILKLNRVPQLISRPRLGVDVAAYKIFVLRFQCSRRDCFFSHVSTPCTGIIIFPADKSVL